MTDLIFRGTPVTCAKDAEDLLYAVAADVTINKIDLGNGEKVNANIYKTLERHWTEIKQHLVAGKRSRFAGHSLGASSALVAAGFAPPDVPLSIFSYAPFQCANKPYWDRSLNDREVSIWGRRRDFSLGWDHADTETCLAGPITHAFGGGVTEIRTDWPIWYESEPDHDVNGYCVDLRLLAGAPSGEFYTMCQLSAAVYATEIADMIAQMAKLNFNVIDVIESAGFRCAVVEEIAA